MNSYGGIQRNLRGVFAIIFVLASFWHLAFPLHAKANDPLPSPVYAEYNTFLDMINILELISVGRNSIEVELTIYKIDGDRLSTVNLTIEPGNQQDIIVNDLLENDDDTYGVIKLEFDPKQDRRELIGRMSYYRSNTYSDGYSFVFSRQLNEPTTGTSYTVGNSFDPQMEGYLVPNWVQVTNLSSGTNNFTINLYNQQGTLLGTTAASLGQYERRDFPGGHEYGEGVYLAEIVPASSSTEYVAAVTRYGTNAIPGTETEDYAFAFSLDTRAGTGQTQYSLITNLTTDDYAQTNWVEVVNVSTSAITATLKFYDDEGNLLSTSIRTLWPRTQFHYNASSLLDEGAQGSVHISTDTASSLLVQTTAYYHKNGDTELYSAYSIPSSVPTVSPIVGSFNRFLEMQNGLVLISTSTLNRDVDVELMSQNTGIYSGEVRIRPLGLVALDLNDGDTYNTQADTYGTISLDSSETATFIAYTIRTGLNEDGTVDYVNPTVFR